MNSTIKLNGISIAILAILILFASSSSLAFAGIPDPEPEPDPILGNGPIFPSINLFNENLSYPTPGTAVFTWNTNAPATSRVVYGYSSQKAFIPAIQDVNYGYDHSTMQDDTLVFNHSVTIMGLTPGTQYFFRPESRINNYANTGNEKTTATQTTVTGTGGSDCNYIGGYLRMGDNDNQEQVARLQTFLRDQEGFSGLVVNGIFDQATLDAVMQFQLKYKSEILDPWGIDFPTGYVYYTTQKKINELYCGASIPLTENQINEMSSFKSLIESAINNNEIPDIDFETIGQGDNGLTDGSDNDSLQASAILTGGDDEDKRGLFFRVLNWFRNR